MTRIARYLFGNEDAQNIVTRTIDGEHWYMASIVCQILGITNHSIAVNGIRKDGLGLTDNERCKESIFIGNYGKQKVLLVNDNGMLKLIFQGKSPWALEVQERARRTPENLRPESWSDDILGR
jgi:prophage antirepressor-like protein